MTPKILFFDIETILDESKNREEIFAKRDTMREELQKQFDFMPEFHQILTICVGTEIEEGKIFTKNLEWSEKFQIEKFFELAEKYPILCGYNIKGFDIPFIVRRALHLGIKIPNSLKLFGKKPWDMTNFLDLKEVYRHTGMMSASLDVVCYNLGIPTPKDGIDGSQVQDFHDACRDKEILEYCERDVVATVQVYKKMVELNLI